MYQCIGKFGMFKFMDVKGCGEKFSIDFDKCPICRGYLIPESMVTEISGRSVAVWKQLKEEDLD